MINRISCNINMCLIKICCYWLIWPTVSKVKQIWTEFVRDLLFSCAHLTPSILPPHHTNEQFSACVSTESTLNIFPTPQKSYPKFQNPTTTFPPFSAKKRIVRKERVGPQISFFIGILIFLVRPVLKFSLRNAWNGENQKLVRAECHYKWHCHI